MTTSPSNIPDAAVEAAAEAIAKADGSWAEGEWEDPDVAEKLRDEVRRWARAALEAAAPHMLAESWESGAVAGWKQSGEGWNAEYPDESTGKCSVDLSENPYR